MTRHYDLIVSAALPRLDAEPEQPILGLDE